MFLYSTCFYILFHTHIDFLRIIIVQLFRLFTPSISLPIWRRYTLFLYLQAKSPLLQKFGAYSSTISRTQTLLQIKCQMKGFSLKLKSSVENVCLRAQATRRFFSPTEINSFFKNIKQK